MPRMEARQGAMYYLARAYDLAHLSAIYTSAKYYTIVMAFARDLTSPHRHFTSVNQNLDADGPRTDYRRSDLALPAVHQHKTYTNRSVAVYETVDRPPRVEELKVV